MPHLCAAGHRATHRTPARIEAIDGDTVTLDHPASAVGFLALARVAAEFSVIMLLYLRQAWQVRLAARRRWWAA
jgi:hypothetical protein